MLAAALSAAMLTIGDVVSSASNVYLSDEPVAESSSVSGVLTRDYVGNLVYEDGVLVKVLVEGGYVDMTGDSPEYMFYVTDHLGSVRVVADSDGNVLPLWQPDQGRSLQCVRQCGQPLPLRRQGAERGHGDV